MGSFNAVINIFCFSGFAVIFILLSVSRLLFLVRTPLGRAVYLANVIWEALGKKTGASRFAVEWGAALLMFSFAGLKYGGYGVFVISVPLLLLELGNRMWERKLLSATYDTMIGGKEVPTPCVCPVLTFSVFAPFVSRNKKLNLGALIQDVPFALKVIVANHSSVACRNEIKMHLKCPAGWKVVLTSSPELAGRLDSGAFTCFEWQITPTETSAAGNLFVHAEWAKHCWEKAVYFEGVTAPEEMRVIRADIKRYPGARTAAFAWRGDMDQYDKSTMQSVDGLQKAFDLSAQFCMPQSMYLSSRLTLDQQAADQYAQHYQVDLGSSEIPFFIDWMNEHVDFRARSEYPVKADKPYIVELGNHGHLHYDTDASACPENEWATHQKPGQGSYPWVGEDKSSFGEQKDNILECARWCKASFNYTPLSWAKPGRGNDSFTAQAADAAGCEVLSGSDIRAADNVIHHPPPHHPSDTNAVELTTRFPCDPQHIYHYAMLQYWLARSYKLGLPMIFMCHQHMRLFAGTACMQMSRAFLWYATNHYENDLYIDTVFGIGKYWKEVLSDQTKRVKVSIDGSRVVVVNDSDVDFESVPVDLKTNIGCLTRLVDVQAGATIVFHIGKKQ